MNKFCVRKISLGLLFAIPFAMTGCHKGDKLSDAGDAVSRVVDSVVDKGRRGAREAVRADTGAMGLYSREATAKARPVFLAVTPHGTFGTFDGGARIFFSPEVMVRTGGEGHLQPGKMSLFVNPPEVGRKQFVVQRDYLGSFKAQRELQLTLADVNGSFSTAPYVLQYEPLYEEALTLLDIAGEYNGHRMEGQKTTGPLTVSIATDGTFKMQDVDGKIFKKVLTAAADARYFILSDDALSSASATVDKIIALVFFDKDKKLTMIAADQKHALAIEARRIDAGVPDPAAI
ncbi:hypothetical protein ACQUFY_02310 [Robbsia andropogonis]|uniref:hypothetical protein n=1 Tax=Robbsia andropogonis TaxID=28092 RepID=UPI000A707107|nr:hypothetical protein [Robbsia andropogonis]MCP1117835.1 hypothetical protein [Robbsia andropogonis]MCP1127299.1 hypothetical protein [Robbsia andropogonis]